MAMIAAIDVGNDALKGYFNGLEQQLYIPNVIAEIGNSREVIEFERNSLDGLHVEILSGALQQGKGTYAVGKLATRYENNDELVTESEKSQNDQTVVLLLTALAHEAIGQCEEEDGMIEANYYLSTGLPLDETKQKKRKGFREKLIKNQHEIRFLDTPEIAGKVVRIKFEHVLINTEGFAALIDLTTNDDGTVRNEDLTKMTVMINDIGGLSTDTAVILPDGSVDNLNSDGIKAGVSTYLDEIMDRVYREYRYKFQSRRQLVDVITSKNAEEQNHIWVKGNRQSIQAIVDEVLAKLAKEEYKHIQRIWAKVPGIRVSFQIGGGAVVLKPYIETLNKQGEQYPLRFVSQEESVWMIARAYAKLLQIYMHQKGISLETVKA